MIEMDIRRGRELGGEGSICLGYIARSSNEDTSHKTMAQILHSIIFVPG